MGYWVWSAKVVWERVDTCFFISELSQTHACYGSADGWRARGKGLLREMASISALRSL